MLCSFTRGIDLQPSRAFQDNAVSANHRFGYSDGKGTGNLDPVQTRLCNMSLLSVLPWFVAAKLAAHLHTIDADRGSWMSPTAVTSCSTEPNTFSFSNGEISARLVWPV